MIFSNVLHSATPHTTAIPHSMGHNSLCNGRRGLSSTSLQQFLARFSGMAPVLILYTESRQAVLQETPATEKDVQHRKSSLCLSLSLPVCLSVSSFFSLLLSLSLLPSLPRLSRQNPSINSKKKSYIEVNRSQILILYLRDVLVSITLRLRPSHAAALLGKGATSTDPTWPSLVPNLRPAVANLWHPCYSRLFVIIESPRRLTITLLCTVKKTDTVHK